MTYLAPFFPLLLLTAAAGLFQCWRRPGDRRGLGVAALGLAGVFLFSWPPVSSILLGTLEWRYPHHPLPDGEAQAIVVLASYVLPPTHIRPYPVLASDTYQRCLQAAWLHKHWRPLPVLASGGKSQTEGGPAYADTMRRVLQGEGVPEAMLWTEARSASTHEAAVYCAEILRQKGIQKIALVTEAFHMPRAERCFGREGLTVIPAPCRFHSISLGLDRLLPGDQAINQDENVMHEWIGLLWYRIRGWI